MQYLLEIYTNDVRTTREFIQEEAIVRRLKILCKAVKETAINKSILVRLQANGKVRLGGVYVIRLYTEESNSEVIEAHKNYIKSKLPTFVEYIRVMKDRYCPKLQAKKQEFNERLMSSDRVDLLGKYLEDLQKSEAEIFLWRKLIGVGWSVIDQVELNTSDSVGIHSAVNKYLDEAVKDIVRQASYGSIVSTDQMYNILEGVKIASEAKWYREYGIRIKNLVEGEDYR